MDRRQELGPWWLCPDWSSLIAWKYCVLVWVWLMIHLQYLYTKATDIVEYKITWTKGPILNRDVPIFPREVADIPKNSTVPEAQHGHTLTRHWSSHGKLMTLGKLVKPQRLLELSSPYASCFCYQNYQSWSERLSVKSVFSGDIIVKQPTNISFS